MVMGETHFCMFYDVADYDAVVAFYRDTLGFPVKSQWDDDGHKRGTVFKINERADLEIMGVGAGMEQKNPPPRNVRLKFYVKDIDAEYARLQAAGVTIIEAIANKPWRERTFGIQAPDGLKIYLYHPL